MKKIIAIGFLFFAAGNCFGQITFQKIVASTNLGEAKQTSDSGFIAVGWIINTGHQNVCLLKLDANGDTIWTRVYGGSEDVLGMAVDITSDGGYILTGWTYPTAVDSACLYLIKINAYGDTLWTRKYNGVANAQGRCVHQTFDGGYIVSGETGSFIGAGIDTYILKTDSIGNIEWEKIIGGPNWDYCYSICQTSDSGFVALVSFNRSSAYGDIVLIKMNSLGDTLWSKSYGGGAEEIGFEIKETFSHELVVAGFTNSFGSGGSEVYFLKMDSKGNLIWSKTYGGPDTEWGYSIDQTTDGGFILSGSSSSFNIANMAQYVIRVDTSGNVVWSSTYNDKGGAVAFSIVQTFDGGYFMAGEEYEIIKINSTGSSGCNEQQVTTITSNPPTIVDYPAIPVTSFFSLSKSTSTVIESGVSLFTVCTNVGINSIPDPKSAITISPNLTTNNFTITFPTTIYKGTIVIYNVFGEKIYIENIADVSQKEIRFKNIDAGIYFVKVRDEEKEYSKQLVIE